MTRILTSILALTAATACLAASPDSTLTEQLSLWNGLNARAWQNPALHEAAYTRPFTTFYAEGDYRHQSERFILQHGRGHWLPQLKAESFVRLSPRTAFWGSASYTNGRNRAILWNSVADFDLLEPDILGDTIGGDTHRERYCFAGGYGTHLGRWHLGGEMDFRAEQEFRRVDPRMRSIVSDLTLRVGAGLDIKKTYTLALALEGNIYRQTNSVDFYKPLGSIPEFQMMGLGTTYERFSGDINDLYFRGGGTRAAIDVQPVGARGGLFASIDLSESRYERVARLLNSLPLSTLYRQGASAEIGYKRRGGLDWAVWAEGRFTKHSTDQHLAGTSSTQVFPILLDATVYKNYTTTAAVGAMVGQSGPSHWHARLRGGYSNSRHNVPYPRREMDYDGWFAEGGAQWMTGLGKRTTLTTEANARRDNHASGHLVLPYADMEPHFTLMMNHNYRYLTADYTTLSAQVRADHRLAHSHYGFFARAAAARTWCSTHAFAVDIDVAVGLTF